MGIIGRAAAGLAAATAVVCNVPAQHVGLLLLIAAGACSSSSDGTGGGGTGADGGTPSSASGSSGAGGSSSGATGSSSGGSASSSSGAASSGGAASSSSSGSSGSSSSGSAAVDDNHCVVTVAGQTVSTVKMFDAQGNTDSKWATATFSQGIHGTSIQCESLVPFGAGDFMGIDLEVPQPLEQVVPFTASETTNNYSKFQIQYTAVPFAGMVSMGQSWICDRVPAAGADAEAPQGTFSINLTSAVLASGMAGGVENYTVKGTIHAVCPGGTFNGTPGSGSVTIDVTFE